MENKLLYNSIKSFKTIDGYCFAEIHDIVRFEADRNYTFMFVNQVDKPIKLLYNISKIEVMMQDYNVFFKCHRSHIVNVLHIHRFIEKTNELITGKGKVQLSESHTQNFKSLFHL
jgi:two-component system, LytTR family, response regulator